jgi:hypothetical protein
MTCALEELILCCVGDITVEVIYDICALEELMLCHVGNITVEVRYDIAL